MSAQLMQPDWMQPNDAPDASYGGDFRCALEGRSLIEASGSDAADFLHSQFSTDVRAMEVGDIALTSYSDAKGRLVAIPRLCARESGFLLELPADRVEAVLAQLRRYVLRSDVLLEDISASRAAFAAVGEEATQCVTDAIAGMPPPAGKSLALDGDALLFPVRGPRAGWIVLGPVEAVHRAWDALDSLPVVAPGWWEAVEIDNGIPTVREATAGHFVAQMVNLDRLDALDFRKGCYPGQEVIARTHYLGRVKRRMYPLQSTEAATVPAPGDRVFADAGDSPAGEIVRACRHPEGGIAALAVLRIEALDVPLSLADGTPLARGEPPYPLDEAA